jgi:hypothetical protein
MCKVVVLPSLKVTSIKPWERREGPLRFAVGWAQVRAYKSGLGGLLGERRVSAVRVSLARTISLPPLPTAEAIRS